MTIRSAIRSRYGSIASKYGLKPKGDYDKINLSEIRIMLEESKYGLKPKGDYDFLMISAVFGALMICPNTD